MLNFHRTVQIKLASGEEIVGRMNYTTTKIVEVILPDGSFRDLKRDDIKSVGRVQRGDV